MKKVFALLCILAVMVSISVFTPTPAEAAENAFQVGYARVDINPYVVDGDFSSGIMQLPLRGSGDVWNRLSTKGLVDDNGDGVIDENDGLKATCVAVTDHNGNTVLLINVDLIGGTLINKVNVAIVERVEAAIAAGELSNVNLPKENIYYGGTHTHNAPDTTVYASGGKTGTNNDGVSLKEVNENLGIWINRTIEDVADAAIIALKDRAAATVTKDQISASQVQDEVVKGKKMVTTRHLINTEDGSIAGDNFNDRGNNPKQITEADDTMYLLNFKFEDPSKLPVILTNWRGHPSLNNSDTYENGGTHCMSSDYVNAYRHALEFGVDVTIDTEYGVGHVASWELGDTQKYRVIFFNGTGGNTNPRNTEVQRDENGNALTYGSGTTMRGYSWIDVSASKAEIKGRACSYGVVLATMAQECLNDGKNESAVSYGEIRTIQQKVATERKTVGITQIGYNAANAYWEADAMYDKALASYNTANSKFSAYKTAYNKYKDAGFLGFLYKGDMEDALSAYNTALSNLNALLTPYVEYMTAHTNNTPSQASTTTVNGTAGPTKPLQSHPFIYKEGDQVYCVGSRFHASAIQGDWDATLSAPKTAGSSYTLNAFMLGEDAAFVVIPGEPFDYYYTETGVYTPENNLWNILKDTTYGKPYVFGYTNGAVGYFPNYEAYFYNEGSTTKVMGAYETHTSDFAPGTGENMVRTLDSMLGTLNGTGRTAYCEHCKKDVQWTLYTGQDFTSGHYYLNWDVTTAQKKVADGMTVCLDLNGYTFKGESRAFYNDQNASSSANKATLSIMDSSAAKTGVVEGCGGDLGAPRGFGGGVIIMGQGHELNIYGGTLRAYDKGYNSASSGVVLLIRGTMNMYGGKIEGGKTTSCSGQFYYSSATNTKNSTGYGGALYLTGTLNMYGGSMTSGTYRLFTGVVEGTTNHITVTEATGPAPCVCVTTYNSKKGVVNLYNDASIEHLYFSGLTETQFNVHGNYTGKTQVEYSTKTGLAAGSLVGNAKENANVSRGELTIKGVDGLYMAVSGNNLVLAEHPWSYGHCEACNKTVQWQPMNDADFDVYNASGKGPTQMEPGHYRLDADVPETEQKQLNGKGDHPGTFCIDLAGHTFVGKTRAFYTYDDTVLNIMDSVGGGAIEGKCSSATGGGVLYLQGNTVCNLYGGTIRHNNPSVAAILNGGAVRVNGATLRMYGGTLVGKDVTDAGAAIYATLRNSVASRVELLGGTIQSANAGKGGNSVYITKGCTVVIAGSVQVADIYFAGAPADALTVDTTKAAFTGSVQLTCATTPAAGASLGTCTGNKGITAGSVKLTDSTLPVVVEGGKLVTKVQIKSFHLMDKDGMYGTFDTFAEALAAYTYDETRGNYIQLTKDVSKATINKTVVVDLNGFYLMQPTIATGVTLYGMDSQTDDFTIEDDFLYGMVYNAAVEGSGKIEGLPAESAAKTDGYLVIREGTGYSFHRVSMNIKAMSLRPGTVGLYYTCQFMGDEIVCENVKSYGIALSAWMEPNAANLNEMCMFTASTEFVSGEAQGVLLSGIMKSGNTTAKNTANAETAVFGRAYIETEEGYSFGVCVTRTLRQQLEDIDAIWSSLTAAQKSGVLEMYEAYADTMGDWNIPNIKKG